MRLRSFLLASSLLGGFCQLTLAFPPDFSTSYRFTNRPGEPTDGVTVYSGATSTLPINNSAIGCVGFSFTYNSEGFSGVSINFQTSPKFQGGQASGTWSTFGGTATTGALPMTGTSQGTYVGYGYYPFLRINLGTATGTGSIDVQFQCWKSISYASTLGGGGGGGTITATSIIQANLVNDSSGSSTAYAGNVTNCPGSLSIGQSYQFIPNQTNSTTTPSLNICSLGALNITHVDGSSISVSELDASGTKICQVLDIGTTFLLIPQTCSIGPGFETIQHINASSVPNPPSGSISYFYDNSNSDHASLKNSSGTVTDLQVAGGFTKSPWSHTYFFTNTTDGGGVFSGASAWCAGTSPCSIVNYFTSNPIQLTGFTFPTGSDTNALITDVLPANWNSGVVTLDIINSPTANSGTITFNAQTRCTPVGSSPFSSSGFNTANVGTLTITSVANMVDHSITLTMTGCSAGNYIQIIVTRKGSTDTNTGDARVLQLMLSGFGTLS